MPIYEYRCEACDSRSSRFLRSMNPPAGVSCARCGSEKVHRIMSRFARSRTVREVHEASGPPPERGGSLDYYRDPRNIGRWVEQKFQDADMEMPQQVRDRIDAAREGELPPEVDL